MRRTLFMGLLYFIAKVSPPLYLIKSLGRKKIHVTSKRANFLSKILNLKVTKAKYLLHTTVYSKNEFFRQRKVEPLRKVF